MRIIRKSLQANVVTLLKNKTRELGVEDWGFTADVFCLMQNKGNGIPSAERIDALVTAVAKKDNLSKVSLGILVKKRVQVLKQLVATSYFRALAISNKGKSIEAVGRLCLNLRKLYLKTRESQCVTCALLSQCDFGKQYQNTVRNVGFVVDPNWELAVNANCPSLPQISCANQLAAGAKSLLQLAQASTISQVKNPNAGEVQAAQEALVVDEVEEDTNEDVFPEDSEDNESFERDYNVPSGCGKGARYDVRFQGNSVWEFNEQLIDSISKQELVMFELGQKLSLSLLANKKGAFAPVTELAADKDKNTIKTVSDLPQVESSQHGLPSKLFNARLQKKTLTKTQNLKREAKKQLFYALLDGSDSMLEALGTGSNKLGLHSKAQLAVTLLCAFLRRVRDDGGMAFIRIFGSYPGPLIEARTKAEFDALIQQIFLCNFDSGTDINAAIDEAVNDITTAKDEIARAELLLITDCEASLDAVSLKKKLGKIELSVLDATGSRCSSYSNGSAVLKQIAKKYFKSNEQALTVQNLVELL